ncbi:MAG: hypothetical protein U1C18_03055, partial [Patescibacteria group bacterium]|nr:hypothetical protein [Patescibacteria group bacterium]
KALKGHPSLLELDSMRSVGEITAFVFESMVEEKLMEPTIIYDYPVENCAVPVFPAELTGRERSERAVP